MAIAGDPSGVSHASEQISDVTLGGVRQTAIPKNVSAALELVSGGHLNAPPWPSVDPHRLTCGVRILTVFPSPPRRENEKGSWRAATLHVLSPLSRSLLRSHDRSTPTRLLKLASGIVVRLGSSGTTQRPMATRPTVFRPPQRQTRGAKCCLALPERSGSRTLR